ncbi:MAG: L-2-amino-thiazoline-4-carboxylic acid hydrolase [Chloroflexota bacterium]
MNRQPTNKFWLGLAIGTISGIILGKRLASPPQLPHRNLWQPVLEKEYGEVKATLLITQAQKCYEELHRYRPRFSHPPLRLQVVKNILPGLALYKTLRLAGEGQESALALMESMLRATFSGSIKMVSLLKYLPCDHFNFFRKANLWMVRLGFPPQGWEMELIEDSANALAYNAHRCMYLEVLRAYDAPELTPLFCQTDDWIAEALPKTIRWERTKTIGRGENCCDFRWSRATEES